MSAGGGFAGVLRPGPRQARSGDGRSGNGRAGQAGRAGLPERFLFVLPLVYGLAVATFFVLRSLGRWTENDTASLASAISGVLRAQRLLPSDGTAYVNGYAYQALMVFLAHFTGLSVPQLQQLLAPFLFVLILLPVAWVAYRELTGRAATATLAMILLLLQPEFLFVSLRGSHEKVTRTLMLLALLFLARSFRPGDHPGRFAVNVVLFYAAGYGIIASNNMFGTSFVAALIVTLLASWLLSYVSPAGVAPLGRRLTGRLLYSTVILLGVAFVFTFYAYPPATNQLNVYEEIWKKVTVLLLNVGGEEAPAGDPYGLVVAGWISLPVYFLVSLANWLLIGASAVFWVRDGWRWLVRREAPTPAAWLLWLLYAAFAFQGVLSVAVDFSGAIASNFQHRAFASFVLVAAPITARGLISLLGRPVASLPGRAALHRATLVALAALVGCLSLLSLFKATNEPLLSHKWMFYEGQEMQALGWATANMRNATIATDFDERLTTAHLLAVTSSLPVSQRFPGNNSLAQYRRNPAARDFLISDTTRRRAQRLGFPLPAVADQLLIYDNGTTQLYHLVPETPRQR
jgi:hypothetical protein